MNLFDDEPRRKTKVTNRAPQKPKVVNIDRHRLNLNSAFAIDCLEALEHSIEDLTKALSLLTERDLAAICAAVPVHSLNLLASLAAHK